MGPVKPLPASPDAIAPDGSEVRLLLGLAGGGAAHFTLAGGQTSVAVRHRSVEEIWFILAGRGQVWRRLDDDVAVDGLAAGDCFTIPLGTQFQFRSLGPEPLEILGLTLPPWPGEGEAIRCEGPWSATSAAGPGLAEPG